ncbi:competence protein ComJ [Gilliamella apicola]|uniref:competence protein ComJ n=1 Tax=Gilliamella apicola TaxID=1196095 RepID=UPI002FEE56C6
MEDSKNQMVDLLISHNQILVRSRAYSEKLSQWGKENIEQGAVIHKDYVIFDPLPEEAFGANVFLKLTDNFVMDENTQRCIVTPFYINNSNNVEVASATEQFKINIKFDTSLYELYYEICEDDEVFYKFTFVPAEIPTVAKYLMDDPWGGEKDKALKLGFL